MFRVAFSQTALTKLLSQALVTKFILKLLAFFHVKSATSLTIMDQQDHFTDLCGTTVIIIIRVTKQDKNIKT